MLRDLSVFLGAKGLGTPAQDIFIAMLPDSPDDAMVLYEYQGRGGTYGGDGNKPYIEYPRVQIVTRSKVYEDARAKLQSAYLALEGIDEEAIGSSHYFWVKALSAPAMHPSGRDENNRYRCMCNFEVMKGV